MRFDIEWDAKKEASNLAKHGVSFSEAATLLGDPLSIIIPDRTHSYGEERMLLFGRSELGRYLLAVITERAGSVRLISARRMTPRERRTYEQWSQS